MQGFKTSFLCAADISTFNTFLRFNLLAPRGVDRRGGMGVAPSPRSDLGALFKKQFKRLSNGGKGGRITKTCRNLLNHND